MLQKNQMCASLIYRGIGDTSCANSFITHWRVTLEVHLYIEQVKSHLEQSGSGNTSSPSKYKDTV